MGGTVVKIDGQSGEGGGQVLRSALCLSALTGLPLHLVNVRAGRAKPGLMPQHLQAVTAAAAIAGAATRGAEIGSRELCFTPGHLAPGDYRFDIGTAGATSLVLQTIYLPLAAARAPSTVTVTGGTHVPFSPSFHYLQLQWLPFLRRLGLELHVELSMGGFYPRGGGRIDSRITPVQELRPLQLSDRGSLVRIRCLSLAANLPLEIAERQSRQAAARLSPYRSILQIENAAMTAAGKGTLLLLQAEFERSSACYFALGERGRPAEKVADSAAEALLAFLATDAAVDEFLADQLALPLALADGESFLSTPRLSRHLLTNLEVIAAFLPVRFGIDGNLDEAGGVRIRGVPLRTVRNSGERKQP
jgi:RNA 3'-terminal phosphate cyclase (ATP)